MARLTPAQRARALMAKRQIDALNERVRELEAAVDAFETALRVGLLVYANRFQSTEEGTDERAR